MRGCPQLYADRRVACRRAAAQIRHQAQPVALSRQIRFDHIDIRTGHGGVVRDSKGGIAGPDHQAVGHVQGKGAAHVHGWPRLVRDQRHQTGPGKAAGGFGHADRTQGRVPHPHFFGHPASAQQGAQPCQHARLVHRLCHHVIRPGLQCGQARVRITGRKHDDDGYSCCGRILPQLPQGRHAPLSGQAAIHQNKIRQPAARKLKPGGGIFGHKHLIARFGQLDLQHDTVRRNVVYDKDPARHGCLLYLH